MIQRRQELQFFVQHTGRSQLVYEFTKQELDNPVLHSDVTLLTDGTNLTDRAHSDYHRDATRWE